MDSLRLILLIAGVALVIGIYLTGHLAHRRKAARSDRHGRLSKGVVDVSALAGLRAVEQQENAEADDEGLDPSDPFLPDPSLPIIALTLIARRGSMSGSAIIEALELEGLKPGPMRIYHYRYYPEDSGESSSFASSGTSSGNSSGRSQPIVFSIANAVEPGVLEPKTLHEERTPGLVVFMNASDPMHTMRTLDAMLSVGVRLARRLDAILGDAERNYLTPRARDALREHALNLARNQG